VQLAGILGISVGAWIVCAAADSSPGTRLRADIGAPAEDSPPGGRMYETEEMDHAGDVRKTTA
jgi:hypothetical protein